MVMLTNCLGTQELIYYKLDPCNTVGTSVVMDLLFYSRHHADVDSMISSLQSNIICIQITKVFPYII